MILNFKYSWNVASIEKHISISLSLSSLVDERAKENIQRECDHHHHLSKFHSPSPSSSSFDAGCARWTSAPSPDRSRQRETECESQVRLETESDDVYRSPEVLEKERARGKKKSETANCSQHTESCSPVAESCSQQRNSLSLSLSQSRKKELVTDYSKKKLIVAGVAGRCITATLKFPYPSLI